MLGEQFEEPDFVVGMVLKLRPQFDKIDIWMRNADKQDAIAATKAAVVRILQVDESEVELQVFQEVRKQAQENKKFNKNFKKQKNDGPIVRADNKEEEVSKQE